MTSMHNIPIIDFSLFETEILTCAQQIKEACVSIGFFYLRHHGIDQSDIDNIFAVVRMKWGAQSSIRLFVKTSYFFIRRSPKNIFHSQRKQNLNTGSKETTLVILQSIRKLWIQKHKKLAILKSKESDIMCLITRTGLAASIVV